MGVSVLWGTRTLTKLPFLKEEEGEGRRDKSDLQRLAVGDLWGGGGTAVES